MSLSVKSKILLTVLSVVLMFTFFILFYFPSRQQQTLLKNYNEEIKNFANSVALGVEIALTEQNFDGVETAIDFVRDDERLQSVSIIQIDSVLNPASNTYTLKKSVFKTFPEGSKVDVNAESNDLFIFKSSPFSTPTMSGEVMLSFSTEKIVASMKQIRLISILASLIVFGIGLVIGYLLAKNISNPVLALRDAAKKVGEGDLSQSVTINSKDEIGELATAFNKMVRELRIEAALEKIRNRTIAMQRSDEWDEVIDVCFEQMEQLGFNSIQYRVILRDYHDGTLQYWDLKTAKEKPAKYYPTDDITFPALADDTDPRNVHYEVREILPDGNNSYSRSSFGQTSETNTAELSVKKNWVVSTAFTNDTALEAFGYNALSPSNEALLRRLTKIISQSYTRYLDVKKSEEQALEAIKQASLDRIRGEVASMRSKDDLNKITPLVWRELTTLKVPFIRCGVFIVDPKNESILCILSSPEGQALGLFTMNIKDTELTFNIFKSWKYKEVYTEHWNRKAFLQWTSRLIELGHVESQRVYQGASKPPESLNLHFVPFKQGMLYVGNNEPLSSDDIELVKSLAKVFSIAFARYEDFKELEKAKSEVDEALSELKSTQSQLVLSEKMASLGELTAGIAHEIQNPLNFVNNFSELSAELIEEFKNDNHDEAVHLIESLKQNLEKINHHGNRASSIVKGMLEHSRESSGQKELCDINIIADEYLRLAYHGLRAKDKSFNAKLEVNFDKALPKISIIAQDISRVLLNLINNAFYAVSEKARRDIADYKPCITVSTEKIEDRVKIRIKDNGEGIPKDVVDKIFQPFFTTKPTGKGTGLGLSISYDIVTKGHNGKLTVVTKNAENNNMESGTEFIVSLPIVT